MSTAKYTIPASAEFAVVVTTGHVRIDISEMSMNGAANFTLATYAAAVRAKLLAEFDAVIKNATKASDHVNVEDLGDAVDYRTTFIGADGKPATVSIGFDAPIDTSIAQWPARAKLYPGLPVSDLKDEELAQLRSENALLKARFAALTTPGREPIISTSPTAAKPA